MWSLRLRVGSLHSLLNFLRKASESWGKLVSLKFRKICWLDLFKKQDMGGGLRQYHWKVSNIYYLGLLPSSLWPPLKGSFFKIFRQLAWASSVNAAMIICMSCRDDHPTLHMSFFHEAFVRISWYDHLPQVDHSRCNLNWRLPGLGRYNIAYALDNKVCLQLRRRVNPCL